MTHLRLSSCLLSLALLFSAPALADEAKTFQITMKNHAFDPLELVVPAGEKLKIVVKNTDTAPIEFESSQLSREKVVQPGGEVTILLNPLKAGTYRYVDDFNHDSKGFITVK